MGSFDHSRRRCKRRSLLGWQAVLYHARQAPHRYLAWAAMRRFAPSLFRRMIGLPSAARCTGAAPISFAAELLHKNKTPARTERAGAKNGRARLLSHHSRSEEVENLTDRIGDRAGA